MGLSRYGRLLGGVAIAAAAIALLGGKAMAATDLTVYTAVEAEDLKKYAERFNAEHPATALLTCQSSQRQPRAPAASTRPDPGWPCG